MEQIRMEYEEANAKAKKLVQQLADEGLEYGEARRILKLAEEELANRMNRQKIG